MIKENQKFNESVNENSALLVELREKLPQFFTSDKYDENGKLIEQGAFDFAKFSREMDKENISRELSSGYTMEWTGKQLAKKQAGERSETVIVPDVKHNERPENAKSENLFFTGDNLEVLRHLQTNYQNSVDFIYIDPPYNTGSDGFVYPDKFEYSDEKLKEEFSLNDDELKRLKSIQGRATHSAWLTFMYPRLYLAKKLLKDSGVIFVSIDDNEQANLKLLMDDVFGEGQYVASAPRKTGAGAAATRSESELRKLNDYIFIYSRNKIKFKQKIVGEKTYPFEDEHGKYNLAQFQATGSDSTRTARPNMYYPIYVLKDGTLTTIRPDYDCKTIFPSQVNGLDGRWMWRPETFEKDNKRFINYQNEKLTRKVYYDESQDQTKYQAEKAWFEKFPNKNGTTWVNELMGQKGLFSNPKPVELIKFLLNLVDNKDIVCLDFFAGSSTTADAVMQLNAEDGGNRKFIMVQLPEPTFNEKDGTKIARKGSEAAFNAGYMTIDEISRKRIELAGEKIKSENPLTTENLDMGFKHYRVVKPNIMTIDKIEEFDPEKELLFSDDMVSPFSSDSLNVAGNASGLDTILTTWLVADGYKFNEPVEMLTFANATAHYVGKSTLYIIDSDWSQAATEELLNQIGTHQLNVNQIFVYEYSLGFTRLTELKTNVKQLSEPNVKVEVRG